MNQQSNRRIDVTSKRAAAAIAVRLMLCAAMACPALAKPAPPPASAASASAASAGGASASSGAASSAASNGNAKSPTPGSAASALAAQAASAASAAVAAAAQHAADVVAHLDPRDALKLRGQFGHDVTRRLNAPPADQLAYGQRLQAALAAKGLATLARQYVVLVDRNPNVQAVFIYFRGDPASAWTLIGASPVSTGWPGRYDHFVTPLGVFEHTPRNMDFRAEGTFNENGIRGYGARGSRIFDFGWTDALRGWGKGGVSSMRFQMHATDPDRLEPLLGIRHSKGCVRIPGSLDRFLDHFGVLDAEYQAMTDAGLSLWVLHPDRAVTPWAGRYLVVVDSGDKSRPRWSPLPRPEVRARVPEGADTAD
ncbi:hypothetical protein DWV00_24755 [Trinickia dinghuensis]|uniref:L,D-transpeptidase n=1 Tax=Trinickia dinghuensis TaxID=2291023 RepID=A0A3D8JV82_9BURK|nr:hypothetical protein DWV00_24755 [Trinickia dinghuensis]